jgi:hypothetical protein
MEASQPGRILLIGRPAHFVAALLRLTGGEQWR